MAKMQLEAILKQVHHLVDMKSVTSAGPFLLADIKETAPDAKLFCFPGTLPALARFLLRAYVTTTKNRRMVHLPLVVFAPDINHPGLAIAVGIPPLAEVSAKNFFGKAFKQVGDSIYARGDRESRLKPDLVDPSVVRFPFADKDLVREKLVAVLG